MTFAFTYHKCFKIGSYQPSIWARGREVMPVMVPKPRGRAQLCSNFPGVTLGERWHRRINQMGAGKGTSHSNPTHGLGVVFSLPITCSLRRFADHVRISFHQVILGKALVRGQLPFRKLKPFCSTCFRGKPKIPGCELWVLD